MGPNGIAELCLAFHHAVGRLPLRCVKSKFKYFVFTDRACQFSRIH